MRLRTLPLFLAALLPLLARAAVSFDLPEHARDTPPATVQEVDRQIAALNKLIGSYPIRVKGDDDRRAVYAQWSTALQQAWTLEARAPRAESTFAVLAELYRDGHNLDVKGAAELAGSTLDQCLAAYPDSMPCNFSAAYFYLSVSPRYAPKGEAALMHLRALSRPKVNLEVERGLVFAYLMQDRKYLARTQLQYFLTLAPDAQWARQFLDSLDKGQVIQKNN